MISTDDLKHMLDTCNFCCKFLLDHDGIISQTVIWDPNITLTCSNSWCELILKFLKYYNYDLRLTYVALKKIVLETCPV